MKKNVLFVVLIIGMILLSSCSGDTSGDAEVVQETIGTCEKCGSIDTVINEYEYEDEIFSLCENCITTIKSGKGYCDYCGQEREIQPTIEHGYNTDTDSETRLLYFVCSDCMYGYNEDQGVWEENYDEDTDEYYDDQGFWEEDYVEDEDIDVEDGVVTPARLEKIDKFTWKLYLPTYDDDGYHYGVSIYVDAWTDESKIDDSDVVGNATGTGLYRIWVDGEHCTDFESRFDHYMLNLLDCDPDGDGVVDIAIEAQAWFIPEECLNVDVSLD